MPRKDEPHSQRKSEVLLRGQEERVRFPPIAFVDGNLGVAGSTPAWGLFRECLVFELFFLPSGLAFGPIFLLKALSFPVTRPASSVGRAQDSYPFPGCHGGVVNAID